MSNHSFWSTCKYCGQRIYVAYVLPPNEHSRRWLPFDDEFLNECHLNHCKRVRKTRTKDYQKKKSPPSYICPICKCKLNIKNKAKHMKKVHSD